MVDSLRKNLKHHFGHCDFRPHQREIIESVLDSNPTLAILPTGGGKSITYQLPAIILDGTTVVVSPLISLIRDQTQELSKKNIRVGCFESTLSPDARNTQLKQLASGTLKIFYVAPESLANPIILETLKQIEVALIAIDEAHCISDWGHSFRPSYLYLPKLIRSIKPKSILALTATATKKTASDIRNLFKIKKKINFLRPIFDLT